MQRLAAAVLMVAAMTAAPAQSVIDSVAIGERVRVVLRPARMVTGVLRERSIDGSITVRLADGSDQRLSIPDIQWVDRAARFEVRGSTSGVVTGMLIGSIAFPIGTAVGGFIGHRTTTKLVDGWERLPFGDFPAVKDQEIRYRLNGVVGNKRGTVVALSGDTSLTTDIEGTIDVRRLAWLDHQFGYTEWVRVALPSRGFMVGQFVRARTHTGLTTKGYVVASDPAEIAIETESGSVARALRGELQALDRSVRVETSGRRGAWIGLGIGATLGVLAWVDDETSDDMLVPYISLAGIVGASWGGIIGVFIPHLSWENVPLTPGARRR